MRARISWGKGGYSFEFLLILSSYVSNSLKQLVIEYD
jgi:hypothetical protein